MQAKKQSCLEIAPHNIALVLSHNKYEVNRTLFAIVLRTILRVQNASLRPVQETNRRVIDRYGDKENSQIQPTWLTNESFRGHGHWHSIWSGQLQSVAAERKQADMPYIIQLLYEIFFH
jgi:hypothetical protein